MSLRKLFILTLAITLLLLSACAAPAPTAPATAATDASAPAAAQVVRIGTQPWIGYGPWWIAKEQGIFEKYGIQPELVDFVQDTEVNAAFASGNMDVANLATHTAIKLLANGVDLRTVLLEDASTTADAILAAPGLTTIADLKGKKVAYEEGSTSDLLLNYALSQAGMSLSDIQTAPMPAADAGSALIAGQVDAAVTYEPYISAALAQNDKIKPIYTATEKPGLISDVLAVRTKFAQENPETLTKLLQVWDEALAYLDANPDQGRAIIAKAVGSSPEELATAFDGVHFYSLADNRQELASESGAFAKTLADVQAVAVSIGLIDKPVDLAKLLDTSYLGR